MTITMCSIGVELRRGTSPVAAAPVRYVVTAAITRTVATSTTVRRRVCTTISSLDGRRAPYDRIGHACPPVRGRKRHDGSTDTRAGGHGLPHRRTRRSHRRHPPRRHTVTGGEDDRRRRGGDRVGGAPLV